MSTLDPEQNLTVHAYDGLNRRVSTVRPEGIGTDYVYDLASRLLTYRDTAGNQTIYAYDELDRKTSTTYPDTTVKTYDYDLASNLESPWIPCPHQSQWN